MRIYRSTFYKTHATPEELQDILGERWAICRKTPHNRERYGDCITKREYTRACKLALKRRKENGK